MPSYKKRVHSQRIPQHERPAVTPYEGAYDEKYSSDEENVEYEVDEPDDMTELSNSTVTFSEDIYDSDAIDEMIKNQIRKPSQVSESSIKSDEASIEKGKPPKSILKEKGGSKKKGSFGSALDEPLMQSVEKTPAKSVSPTGISKTQEEAMAEESEKISEGVSSGKDKKPTKGEDFLGDVTKPLQDVVTKETDKITSVQGEEHIVTKSLQSTIPKQIDIITDTAATNKDDFGKAGDKIVKSVTKPLQDIGPEEINKKTVLEDVKEKAEGITPSSITEEGVSSKDFKKPTDKTQKITETEAFVKTNEEVQKFEGTSSKISPSKDILAKGDHLLNGAVKMTQATTKILEGKTEEKHGLTEKVVDVPKDITPQFEKLSETVATAEDDIKKSLQDTFGSVTNAFESKADTAIKSEIIKEITAPKEVTEALKDSILKQADASLSKDITVKAEELIDDITKTVESVLPKSIDKVATEKGDITDKVSEIKGLSLELVKSEVKLSRPELEKTRSPTAKEAKIENGEAKPLKDTPTADMSQISQIATIIIDDLSKEAEIALEGMVKPVQEKATKPSHETDKPFGFEATTKEDKTIKDVAKPLKEDGSSEAMKKPKDDLTKVDDKKAIDISKINGTVSGVQNIGNGVAKTIQKAIEEPLTAAKKDVSSKGDFLQDAISKSSDKVTDETKSETLKHFKESQPIAIVTGTDSEKDKILKNTVDTSKESDKITEVADTFTEVKQKTVTSAKGSENKFLEDTVKTAEATDAKRKVTKSTDIHSPFASTVEEESITTAVDKASNEVKAKSDSMLSSISSGLTKTIQGTFSSITGKSPVEVIIDEAGAEEPSTDETALTKTKSNVEETDESAKKDTQESETESKPRVIFRIESEDDLQSDLEPDILSHLTDSTEDFADSMKSDLKSALILEQMKLEQRLSSMKGGIFDLSDESLMRTKELVDERLRKISDIKPPSDVEEPPKKEKSPTRTESQEQPIKIGRFHITPALVEEVVSRSKDKEIAERLRMARGDDKTEEGVEKELPEKLTEADFEEVIRELQLEGLKTDVYFQPEDKEKEEKKEKTLKRVERRFERMASETLEKEKEEADSVSEEKLDEKREVEFQRMLSQLSSEEVAEYQQEYLQLWEEGGLSSLTPTDDWESRDPDTPENELEDDSPRKSESFRGSHGTGKYGESTITNDAKKSSKFTESSVKSPTSSSKTPNVSEDISPGSQSLTATDTLRLGSSPSEIDQSSGFVSERSDDIPTYGERKKFWEQMSSSQSSETVSELHRSMMESVSSVDSIDAEKRIKDFDETISVKSVKQIFEKDADVKSRKSPEEGGLVKSLTESYSKKIAAGELIMPAVPRPRSAAHKESTETDTSSCAKPEALKDSPGTALVSDLEIKLRSRIPSVPITEKTVISGSTKHEDQSKEGVEFTIGSTAIVKTKKEEQQISKDQSTDSEAEFIAKHGIESVAFDNNVFSEEDDTSLPVGELEQSLQKQFPPDVPFRKSVQERSMSLPTHEIVDSVKAKKRYFEDEMKKEIIVEQIMTQAEENISAEKEEKTKKSSPSVDETSAREPVERITKETESVEKTRSKDVSSIIHDSSKLISSVKIGQSIVGKVSEMLDVKDVHIEKSETEDNEKEKVAEPLKSKKKEEEAIPAITITGSGKKQGETASIGESEDTQSESDVTPEDARAVDNEEAPWEGNGILSSDVSPKDDSDYPKEVRETGIGRWVGQEDLSKPVWEKDELDSSAYKIPTKWERTRSEGASPKDHYVYTPEEHYPDTVWEVPVQEQLEKEEITHDIPIEKQVIVEKDEEEEESETKVKLTEEEAKEIAEEILEYIQYEVENRASFLTDDTEESSPILLPSQVTDYLRHLADNKDLNDQDVRLIESLLIKKQHNQLKKFQTVDTTTSSIDITDEELRSSGADNDISPVESQITKLQKLEEDDLIEVTETSEKMPVLEEDDLTVEKAQSLEVEIVDQTIAEVKESLEAAQEQLIEQHKKKKKAEIFKKESPSEFEFKSINYERSINETIKEQSSDWEKVSEYETITEEGEPSSVIKKSHGKEQVLQEELEQTEIRESRKIDDAGKTEEKIEDSVKVQTQTKNLHEEELESKKFEKETHEKHLITNLSDKEKKSTEISEALTKHEIKDGVQTDKKTLEKKEYEKASKKSETFEEKVIPVDKKSSELDKSVKGHRVEEFETKTQNIPENDKFRNLEISVPESFVTRKMEDHYHSSEDSPRSSSIEESAKSPPMGEEMHLAPSKRDTKSEKSDIIFRHSSSSSINTLLKADRRSGTDLEPYSSSGESHYHSFEQTTSRPCSSDVEVMLSSNVGTTGSSEYESALSQDTSKQVTSLDYHTAVSSLSSRESIKSLDSESSGHLASVEVSSEASETLIPSALELDKDLEIPADESPETVKRKKEGRAPPYVKQISGPAETSKPPADDDFEVISESEVVSSAGEVSEDEETVPDEELTLKMKRSYEMTFQPEPKPIAFSESLDGISKDNFTEKASLGLSVDETSSIISIPDERLASSLEESGSILSMSLSTTSEPSALRTVIELSRTDSEKMDGSLTVSATSIDSASREDLDAAGTSVVQHLTNEMSTSTVISGLDRKTASVTISTSSSDEHGISNVSTQVTSVSRKSSMVDEKGEGESSTRMSEHLPHANGPTQVEYVADYDDVDLTTKTKKTQGHRRTGSTSNFVPTMMWNLSEARTQKVRGDFAEDEDQYESDKYASDIVLTEKEVKNDEKKEADELEDSCDLSFEKYAEERKISEGEEVEELKDYDSNRPQSQISRTDSESGRRPVSSAFSEYEHDSELSDLMKQGSSETEKEDLLERPPSPEPEEMENKDITPEFSSEAQASVTELEMEYSGAYSRRDEYASHVSPIREERSEIPFRKTASDEQVEAERSSSGLHSQTSSESIIAEKHELESGEKEILQKKIKDSSSNDIPDITVTEHMTPVLNQKFQYPESKEEIKEKKSAAKTPDTPASTSSRTSSSSTDQGREYNLDEAEIKKMSKETLNEEKEVNETKDEKESLDSPSSDSFEMLDKPDISDEYVIIEEVGREAQENDQEGKSIQIMSSQKKKIPRRTKENQEEVILSPPPTTTKMTDLKYFPSEEESDLFLLESESPPQPPTRRFVEKLKKRSSQEEREEMDYEQQIEQSKKWVEMQFQGEQAAKVTGGYGYEMEYERAPLEDIKEEDLNELDSSSKMGSMGSQKESIGSLGSVKGSFSSTPDYDVLAGKKYFTRSGDHDDVSMSSLQEFELIEKKIMENGKKSGSSSSQDSLSSKKLGTSSKSGQGDDISQASLREFENLENACATEVKMETKAKQEEATLGEIDEGHESQISESESCETVSAVIKEKIESETEDFEKRMFEIDEIIRQAQSNVEKFSELHAFEKIESMGRGDSYEEVAKVPDLELDMPLAGKLHNPRQDRGIAKTSYSTQVVTKKKIQQWRDAEGVEGPKGSSAVDTGAKSKLDSKKQSDLLVNGGKVKSISVDSLEIKAQEKQLMLEGKDDTISLDSYKRKPMKSEGLGFSEYSSKSDSMEEVSTSMRHHESSSGDYSSSGREDSGDHTYRAPPRSDFMLGSTDSLDPSSSTATHATYQYETDSVMSSSFTSGGSNTMVSSMDNLDLLASGQSVIDLSKDLAATKTGDWLENVEVGDGSFVRKLMEEKSSHGKIPTAPEIQTVTFRGPDAERAFQEYAESLGPEEEIIETEEIDEHGNVHLKKVLRQRVLIRSDESGSAQAENLKKQRRETTMHRERIDLGGSQGFVSEVIEPLQGEEFSHIIHKKQQMVPEVEKIVFRGPDAEQALKEYMESLNMGEEVEETEEVDEDGNVHVKRVIRQRVIVRPGDPRQSESSHVTATPETQKLYFTGPDAERAFEEYMKQLKDEEEIIETQEEDEHGNIRIKKILKEKVLVRPEELNKEQLEAYLKQAHKQVFDGEKYSQRLVQLGPYAQKISFKGTDAEEALREYIDSLKSQDEVVEVEEVDEHGNVHVKKILKQRVLVRPDETDRELTVEELEQYINARQSDQASGGEYQSGILHEMMPKVEKITFRGPDAEKQLQEYMESLGSEEVEEFEETDEDGNVHVKRVIKKRVVVRPEEMQQGSSHMMVPEMHKIAFSGPDAEKNLQDYLESLGPNEEVTEIQEEDEHGNIHVKKVLKQRVVIRPEELGDKELTKEELERYLRKKSQQTTLCYEKIDVGSTEPFVSEIIEPIEESEFSHVIHRKIQMAPEVQKVVFRGPDADKALKAYVEALEPGEDVEEREEVDEQGNVHVTRVLRRKLLFKPEDLEKTGLTGEELKRYLMQFEMSTFQTDDTTRDSSFDPNTSTNRTLTEAFISSVKSTEKDEQPTGDRHESGSSSEIKKESEISRRPPLVSDISMDDEAEYDTTEHDWRHQLEILHAEADEDEIDQNLDAALAASSATQKKM